MVVIRKLAETVGFGATLRFFSISVKVRLYPVRLAPDAKRLNSEMQSDTENRNQYATRCNHAYSRADAH